jgi:hypothetical protein
MHKIGLKNDYRNLSDSHFLIHQYSINSFVCKEDS